jgi:hypothetical protein
VPLSGFLNLSAVYFFKSIPDLFHSGSACGIQPFRASSSQSAAVPFGTPYLLDVHAISPVARENLISKDSLTKWNLLCEKMSENLFSRGNHASKSHNSALFQPEDFHKTSSWDLRFRSSPKTFSSAQSNRQFPALSRRIELSTVFCLRVTHDFSSSFHPFQTEARNRFPPDLKTKEFPNSLSSGVDSLLKESIA